MNSTVETEKEVELEEVIENGKKEKILLIDDDRVFGNIIKTTANKYGLNVETLVDAPSPRRLSRLDDFDFLLLDYDLESTTGFAFAEVLQKAMPHVPVILISSSNRPSADKLLHLPNIIGFVSKWTKPEDFFIKALQLYRNMPVLMPQAAVA